MPVFQAYNQNKNTTLVQNLQPAFSFWSRLKGLLSHKYFDPGQGLWLKPANSIHTFGMKFPLDVIFLDGGSKVVAVYDSLPSGRFILPVKNAQSVLELPAGTILSTKTETGDLILIKPEQNNFS